MSDTMLGAIIAGGVGVLTALVGGIIRWFLDVQASKREKEKMKEERKHQQEKFYLEKRIQAYEGFIEYYRSFVAFFNFAVNVGSVDSVQAFLEKQTVLTDAFKKEACHLASLQLYGHPDAHKLACKFIQTLGVALNQPKEALKQGLQDAAQQLDSIACGMRNEIKGIAGYVEEKVA